jgi:hypothetical protein
MLTYKILPHHIKEIAERNNTKNEKIDVLPSKFFYENEYYYVITYIPSLEDLFIREDGFIPSFHDIKRAMLIVKVYQTSGSTMFNIGRKWASEKTKKIYTKMSENLKSIQEKISDNMPEQVSYKISNVIQSCHNIVDDQKLIEDCFEKSVDLVKKANETEHVSEKEQQELRKYVVEMTRAAVRQNQEQLNTESDRKYLLDYLAKQILKNPSIGLEYFAFRKQEKNMLSSKSPTAWEMGELREMVRVDKPVDELDNAEELIALIRNPK